MLRTMSPTQQFLSLHVPHMSKETLNRVYDCSITGSATVFCKLPMAHEFSSGLTPKFFPIIGYSCKAAEIWIENLFLLGE